MRTLQQIPHALLDLDEIEDALARRSFWEFYCRVNPGVIQGWWQRDAAAHLQQFYEDLVAGRRPKLVLNAPPQHGKSMLVTDFIAWLMGKLPHLRTIFASYSDRLGRRANRRLQNLMGSLVYRRIFPGTRINAESGVSQSDRMRRNSTHIEIANGPGFFRNTTVNGAITGESLDFGILDDPIKGRAEAESQTIRDKVWDWFNDDFMTRFSEVGALLIIMTRWHLDDPIGRLLDQDPDVKVVRYRAIAIEDEKHRKLGAPLFPELKSQAFLDARRQTMDPASWEALFQQNPVPRGGAIVKSAWLSTRYRRRGEKPIRVIQSWDCASKAGEKNAVSACLTLAEFTDRIEVWDVVAQRYEFPDLVRAVKDVFASIPGASALLIEDKDSGQGLIQQLRRDTKLPIVGINPGSLDKVTRLEVETPVIMAGKLHLPETAPWVADFIAELTTFPGSALKDRVDALSQGLRWLREKPLETFNLSPVGVGKASSVAV